MTGAPTPVSDKASAFMLVSTVTAMTQRCRPSLAARRCAAPRPRPPASSSRRPRHARSPSTRRATSPPRPRRRRYSGMSWNFRSRKTRSPLAASVRDDRRPFGGEQLVADLEAADAAAQRVGELQRLAAGRHVERDQELIHACSSLDGIERAGQLRSPRRARAAACSPGARRAASAREADRRSWRCPTCTAVGAGDQELEHVAGRGDAAHADDRQPHRLAAFVDHPHGDRPDRRTAEAADDVGQPRPAGLDVDGHRQERVHERDRVGAGLLGGAGERRDVGDVRRQLRESPAARVTLRTALTTAWVPVRLQPNVMPPSLMLGQEMFSSSAATPSASDRMRASSTYSSMRGAADVDEHDGAAVRAARAASRR